MCTLGIVVDFSVWFRKPARECWNLALSVTDDDISLCIMCSTTTFWMCGGLNMLSLMHGGLLDTPEAGTSDKVPAGLVSGIS